MEAVLWISLGAIAGANARYFISRWAARIFNPAFPYGTLIINITGSMFGFKEYPFFQAPPEAKQVPKVDFGK